MKVLILGATGFIGRALVLRLRRDGHSVMAWVRSPEQARTLLGDEVELVDAGGGDDVLVVSVSRADAVVNLAGEPVIGKRWNDQRRQVLRDSRIGVTERLVRAMAAAGKRPQVLVQGSAVGIYGDRGDEQLGEDAAPGEGFLAELCRDWESAAAPAEALGVRVASLRTGIVLGREGGALAKMLPPFRAGVGGPVGSGKQYQPWIHLHDLVEMITTALGDERWRGPFNGTAPEPVTAKSFARSLGRALHRPAFMPVPGFALKMVYGKAATVLLEGQRAIPRGALAFGFGFAFPDLDSALADLLGGGDVQIDLLGKQSPPPIQGGTDYLERRRVRYLLRARTRIDAPLAEVFEFFSQPGNLGLITPAGMGFVIQGERPKMASGTEIDYRLRIGPVPLRWRTRIEHWSAQRAFVDSQLSGPYRAWWHEHHFAADGNGTVMEDRVYYAPPLGLLGRLVNRLFVAGTLRRVFGYRSDAIRLRFPSAAT